MHDLRHERWIAAPLPDSSWQPIRDHVRQGLTADEWREATQHLPPGTLVEAEVLACLPMGVWVSLGERLAGQVEVPHIIDEKRRLEGHDWPEPGSVVQARVISICHDRQRIQLSIRPSDLTT
jgi:ribosomal protein S1